MHELGITQSLLEAVANEAKQHNGARIRTVGLRLGELAGVDAAALRFCFEALVNDTPWASLTLEIDLVAPRRGCRICGHQFVVADQRPACPQCGSWETALLAGDELELSYLEVDTS